MIDINTLRFAVQLNKLDNSQLPASPLVVEDLLDRIEKAAKEHAALRAELSTEKGWIEDYKKQIVSLQNRLEASEHECTEQARLNGMGASREAALLAKLEAAEKERDAARKCADMLALALNTSNHECANLRAKIAEMEQQEPVGVLHVGSYYGEELQDWEFEANQCACDKLNEAYVRNPMSLPLYALPGAQAQPAKNAVAYLDLGTGGYMDVGTDLTDEELATLPKGRHMLGIIGTYGVDGYVPAQPAPSVPDGWKEAAIAWEVCASIHREYGKGKDPFFNTRQGDFVKHANDARAMLAAAPETKP